MYKISPNVRLEISKDGMKAYITLLKDMETNTLQKNGNIEAKHMNDELKNLVKEIKSMIVIGLEEEKLKQVLRDKVYDRKICIANGVPAIDGKDGYIEYFFDLKKKLTPTISKDGIVDYRELDNINNVHKGDQLARLIPPREGKYGYKVTGEKIPYRKGKSPTLRYGENTTLLEDNISLVADVDGLVKISGGKIVVSKIFEVSSVDKKVGNIKFNGSVIVNKNILNGYYVKADGDVKVKGLVEGGYIQNTGDILVQQGIRSYNRLAVQTKGSIITKFVENAQIESEKNITAEAIMHSCVSSKENIIVIGKRGLIAGGHCRAGREIRANIIGSSMATATTVEIVMDLAAMEEIDGLKEEIQNKKTTLKKVIQSISLLEGLRRMNRLDDQKRKMYIKLINTKEQLNAQLKVLIDKEKVINQNIKTDVQGRIKVAGTVYPGVKIIIGNSSYYVRDEMKRCTFYRDEGDIKVGPY